MLVPFGVPLIRQAPAGQVPQDFPAMLATVRAAANELVADLERARIATKDWTNEPLSDALVETAMASCLHRLADTGCWGEANRLPSGELWRIAGPYLEAGLLQNHARVKPRGYAGDYQMFQWIWADHCCDHPLGRAFDRYFQRQAAPQAVRCRIYQIAALIVGHVIQAEGSFTEVTLVGSGPAIDVQQALVYLPEACRGRLRVTLLDLDPEALAVAQRQLGPLLPPGSLTCIRENLYRLPQRPDALRLLGTPDLLVCPGLFDYLDDLTAAAMLRLFWDRLRPGGLVLVGNFAPHNPSRAYMEWIGNWYLTYRGAEDLDRLAADAGIPRQGFLVGSEPLGVNLFLIGRK
ncbi:MAG: class I SAM-dependent methyltransferase [Thermoguttaceae bacterium]